MNAILLARGECLPFKHFFDPSPYTLANVLPAYIQDPPTECKEFAFRLCVHALAPYAILLPPSSLTNESFDILVDKIWE